jgi:hypothetical protein
MTKQKHHLLRFETKHQPLLPRCLFAQRILINLGIASALIGISLLVGMCGYHYFESMSWIDAFVNAAMILSGMGPIGELHTSSGKLFAGFFALYSGLLLIMIAGIVLAPVVHRFLHRFHMEETKQ